MHIKTVYMYTKEEDPTCDLPPRTRSSLAVQSEAFHDLLSVQLLSYIESSAVKNQLTYFSPPKSNKSFALPIVSVVIGIELFIDERFHVSD